MWQVSISTNGEGEEAVSDLLERVFSEAPSVFHDEETKATVVTVYPKRLSAPRRALRMELRQRLARLRQFGLDPGKTRIAIEPLPRRNWAESWKRHFKPIEIADQLLIKPSWSRRRARPGQRVVILDPGLSFGTGHHPTTLFCLQQIVKSRRTQSARSFLDIGAGSAILAIAAARLGYGPIRAVDCDRDAIRTARRNIRRNRAQDKIQLVQSDLRLWPLRPRQKFDLVCANLTADLLSANAKKISNLLSPTGSLVIAGVLDREFAGVSKKFRRFGLTMRATCVNKSWKSGEFARSDPV